MRFQREPIARLWAEMTPLLEAHYREVAHYQDIPLEPDYAAYQTLEDIGIFRIYTTRLENGNLVGYAAYLIAPHLHYRSVLNATMDVVYIAPEYRGMGRQFIEWCDQQLKVDGVETVTQHVKVAHDFSPMLERMGYEWVEKILIRRLQVIAREKAA